MRSVLWLYAVVCIVVAAIAPVLLQRVAVSAAAAAVDDAAAAAAVVVDNGAHTAANRAVARAQEHRQPLGQQLGAHTTLGVDVIDSLPPPMHHFVRRYVRPRRPVVLRAAASHFYDDGWAKDQLSNEFHYVC